MTSAFRSGIQAGMALDQSRLAGQMAPLEKRMAELRLQQGQQQVQQGAAQQQLQSAKFAGLLGKALENVPREQRRPILEQFSDVVGAFEEGDDSDEAMQQAITVFDGLFGQPVSRTRTLSGMEAEKLGFNEGAVVQEDAEGKLKVIQEGILPVNQLEESLKLDKSKFDQAAKIRSEVEKSTKLFRDIEDSFGRVEASQSGEVTAASDLALIFNFMKMLDPGSVVREGEFANAENTGGVPDRIRNTYNKLLSGERLNETQRVNFVNEAKKQYNQSLKINRQREDEFVRLGERYGLERGDVIIRGEREFQPIEGDQSQSQVGTFTLPNGVQVKKVK